MSLTERTHSTAPADLTPPGGPDLAPGGAGLPAVVMTVRSRDSHSKSFGNLIRSYGRGKGLSIAAPCNNMPGQGLVTHSLHRVAFAIGLLIGPVGWYIRSKMDDTPEFEAAEKTDSPLRTLLGQHFGRLFSAFLIIAMATISVYLITFLPQFAVENLGLDAWAAFPGAVVAGVITFVGAPFAGQLADKVGATTVMIPTA